MNNVMNVEQEVERYQPTVSLSELVKALNVCYHEIEAAHYDKLHEEIWRRELPLFAKLGEMARDSLAAQALTILDYGCGTGFGCSQIVKIMGVGRIKSLVCVDASPAMLSKCKERLDAIFPGARYE